MIAKNGLMGLAFVLITLWLFLEPRLALWVAMGIPISLAGGVVLLWFIGASLNQISTVSMIVVMGIIVDDAIVAGEAIFVHRRMGKDPLTAAVDGIGEVGMPIFASVTTTMIAFTPMMFIPGFMGQFMVQMPLVVITALAVSLIECIFLLPAHLQHESKKVTTIKKGSKNPLHIRRQVSRSLEWFVETIYGPFVRKAVEYRYVTLCFGISLIIASAGLIGGGFVQVQMWPAVEGDRLEAIFEFPPGTRQKLIEDTAIQMEEAAHRVAAKVDTLTGEPLITSTFTAAPWNTETMGHVRLNLLAADDRGISTAAITALWNEEMGDIPGILTQSIEGESIGAGEGTDVSFWLTGNNLNDLRDASNMVKNKLASYDGVYQIADNFKPGKSELHIVPNESAEVLGLTTAEISRQLHAKYFGDEALHLQRGREEVEVRVRLPLEERELFSSLEKIRIKTTEGHEVPLFSVASVTFQEGVSQLNSVDGVRGLRVTAVVDRAIVNAEELNTELQQNFMDTVSATYPGITWSLSGTAQDNKELMSSLKRNTAISMMLIFIILATIFRSYIQPVIIMLIIPYGLVGAILGHLVLGMPLSFLSFAGIVALGGVLVNDSIVLVERINNFLAEGMPLQEAVSKGGQRRFRAIFLTSMSTCAGLSPLIMEKVFSAQIVIPMAVSLAGGVAFGTMLTLVLVPAFLMIMNDMRRSVYWLRKGTWPTPEEVEPRSVKIKKVKSVLTPNPNATETQSITL
jgi:multidrug efflux pump subunit AcrB